MNAIQLLKDDHKKVRRLLAELEKTTPRGVKTRTELLEKIATEVRVHAKIEEEIFYPAFKAAAQKGDDNKMYFEAQEEHRASGELVLPDLERTDPASECFGGRAKVLKELIEHHAAEEEKDMFPRARELLGAEQLKLLGERMAIRKQELLSDPGLLALAASKLLDALTLPVDQELPPPRTRAARVADGARAG